MRFSTAALDSSDIGSAGNIAVPSNFDVSRYVIPCIKFCPPRKLAPYQDHDYSHELMVVAVRKVQVQGCHKVDRPRREPGHIVVNHVFGTER